MSEERKYQDKEVREIFDLATARDEVNGPTVREGDGLSLAEIKEVGLEVGVDPHRIAVAARVLDARQDPRPRESSLGLPISVGRVVELPRPVTDHEWDVLVSVFRETFGAKGKVETQGSIREWTDGTLQAFLEPTETGHRLRLQVRQVGARSLNRAGAAGLAVGLSLITAMLTTGQSPVFLELGTIVSFLVAGGALIPNVLRLPRWAHERERQMEEAANRARALIEEELKEEEPGT